MNRPQADERVRASLGLPPRNRGVSTALASYAAQLGIDASFDLRPHAPAKPQQRSAVEFQALVLPDASERQCANTRDTAGTVAEETGVSTLHLAFGFLEWFESGASEKPLTTPLLLLRVDIDRRIVRSRYQYSVSAVGDEAEVNMTLSERLSRDFRIKLPALGRAPLRHARTIPVRPPGHVPGPARRAVARRPVVPSSARPLLGGREAGEAMFATEHDVDAPAVSAKVPVLVLDAMRASTARSMTRWAARTW